MKCGAGAKHIFLSGTAGVAILLVLTLTKAQLATVVQEVPDNFAMQPPPNSLFPIATRSISRSVLPAKCATETQTRAL